MPRQRELSAIVNTRARFLAIVGGVLALGAKRREDPGWHHVHGTNGLTLSTTAPLEFAVTLLDGTPFRLSDHRGTLVVLNLFATWCGPCRAEEPDVAAFAAAHASDTIVVSVDIGETPEHAREFRGAFDVTYPLALDESQAAFKAIGMKEYPTTLFIRPSGRLACAFVGQLSRADLEIERTHALA